MGFWRMGLGLSANATRLLVLVLGLPVDASSYGVLTERPIRLKPLTCPVLAGCSRRKVRLD